LHRLDAGLELRRDDPRRPEQMQSPFSLVYVFR